MNWFSKTIFSDEQARGWVPWGALAPFLTLILIIIALIGTDALILQPMGLSDEEQNPVGTYGLLGLLFISFGAVGALFWGWIKFVEKRSFDSVGMRGARPMRTFWQGHGIGIAMVLATVGSITIFGGYSTGAVAPALASPAALMQIAFLLAGFAVQSSVEEFVFRGWLLSVMTRKFNLLTAVLVSSLLFSFMHFNPANPWYDNVNTMAFALFACAWVIRTGNVLGVMGWHAGWNWFTAIGFDVPITGLESHTPALLIELIPTGPQWLHGGDIGPEGSVLCTLALVAGTIYWLRRPAKAASTAT